MKRLLVFRFSAMGDVAMTVPVLYSLAKQYPELQITVVSRAAFQAFFEQLPPNVTFFVADLHGKHKGIRGLFRLFKELLKMKFDAVADLHCVLRTFFLCSCFRLKGISIARIDKGRKEKKALIRKKNKVRKQLPSSFERYTKVFNKLGLSFDFSFTSIYGTEEVDTILFSDYTGIKANQKWIGIAPFAKHAEKMYPLKKMEQVVEELSKVENTTIFLFGGGKEEIRQLQEWEEKYPHIINLAGKLKLNGELAAISQLDVMISMDSANMHMASLSHTPVISIWGATHPCCGFMGWKQSIDHAIQAELPCRPCSIFGNKPCISNDYACMNQITPEIILKKVHLFLH